MIHSPDKRGALDSHKEWTYKTGSAHLDQLPEPGAGTIVTYCQSGVRNSVAASALRRAGYDIAELDGSYAGWASRAGNVPVLEAA